MNHIELNRGQVAVVSPEDYGELSKYKWHARWDSHTKSFYAARSGRKDGKRITIRMHRHIMGNPENMQVDHANCDTLDNRRANLRLATCTENNRNRRTYRNNTSGIKGVCFDPRWNKWHARIAVDGKVKSLGYHPTAEVAHSAYCEAAQKYHGEFARTA